MTGIFCNTKDEEELLEMKQVAERKPNAGTCGGGLHLRDASSEALRERDWWGSVLSEKEMLKDSSWSNCYAVVTD